MIRWQRRARPIIAVFGVIFALFVGFSFRRGGPARRPASTARIAPGIVVESTGCTLERFTLSRQDLSVNCAKQVLYADGTSTMFGVQIGTDERNGPRTFKVTAKEGHVGQKESTVALDGDVQLSASDGLTAKTEHATYATNDGMVRATGPVEFARGRMHGTGIGLTYDKTRDVLTLLDQSVVHIAADEHGAGPADVTAGTVTFARHEKFVQFERSVRIQRAGEVIEADTAIGYLT